MELNELIRSALSDAQWLIAKGGTYRAEVLNCVLGKIDNVLNELDGADLIDLNKVWHQFKPNSHPHLTHEENCPEFEEYLKASPNDWWCRTGDLFKKEHRELYWR